jgi:acylphosphatase
MADDRVRYRVRYRGYVQGVGFRMTAVSQSRGLSVNGFVRNEADGSVLMDVEGAAADVKEVMRRIDSAMRDNIDDTIVESMPLRGEKTGFRIAY